MPDGPPLDLDDWLARPQVRTAHRRESDADPRALWAAAMSLRVDDTGRLGRLVRWRIPGLAPDVSFGRLFADAPFTVLAGGPTWAVSGLVGRIWTLRRDYPRLADASAFAAWAEPGTVRVAFAHWVQSIGEGRCALVSEARVEPVDRAAARRLRALWALVGPWERLIGGEALTRAVRAAEQGAVRGRA
jgi:hypothetical protein